MGNKHLSKKEIEKIYQFVKQNDVPYIDLQHELVDHIADSIESTWQSDDSKSFNQCLYETYDDFKVENKKNYPVSNFNKIVKERTSALEKYWLSNAAKYLKEYFKLPLLIITVLLFGGFMTLFNNGGLLHLKIISVATFIFMAILSGYFFLKYKEFEDYLVVKSFVSFYIMYLLYGPYCIASIIGMFPVQDFFSENIIGHILTSLFLSVWTIMGIGAATTFPNTLKKDVLNHLNIRLT